jgi:hypothetical protein
MRKIDVVVSPFGLEKHCEESCSDRENRGRIQDLRDGIWSGNLWPLWPNASNDN